MATQGIHLISDCHKKGFFPLVRKQSLKMGKSKLKQFIPLITDVSARKCTSEQSLKAVKMANEKTDFILL